ncbi:MAG: hypothetical protein ACQKBW_10505 [Puniceicoccales bacterium]
MQLLADWLEKHRGQLGKEKKIADIGFCHRNDAAGGGDALSVELMKLCVEVDLDIYLSEYGFDLSCPADDEVAPS